MPTGFALTSVQKPRNAESFSSLSRISYSAWHHAGAKYARCGATRPGCMSPMRPIDTAAFSCRLRGALGVSRIGTSRWSRRSTHCAKSGSSAVRSN